MKPLRGNYQLGWSRCNTRRTQNDQDLTPSRTEAGLDASDNIHVSVERREKFFFLTSPLIGRLNASALWHLYCCFSEVGCLLMMKISVVEGQRRLRLVIEGKLVAPWTAELRRTWNSAHSQLRGRALV